jgi:C_GCAxxG_C_C family probable redox protein
MNANADQIARRSEESFRSGLCCSESVLQAVAEGLGIQSELIPKIATGLCGGISRSGNICGAVSAGVLGISLCHGRTQGGQSPEETIRHVRVFLKAFEERFGSTNCERLMGCRLDTAEGQQFFKEHNLREKCAGFTREAARLAGEVIEKSATTQATPAR